MKTKLSIALIPGDGVGPEVLQEGVKVLKRAAEKGKISLSFETLPFSADEFLKSRRTLEPRDLERFRNEFDAIFFGALGDARVPDNQHAREILLGMRFELDLFVNFRPVRLLNRKLCPIKNKTEKDVQFVIFRENTEGLYRHVGGQVRKNTSQELALETLINTRYGVERILREACKYARRHNLKRICMVDKSNALRFGHDLWQRLWKELKSEFHDLEMRHLFVDAAAMELIRAPEQFDVIVTENLFGDILSDIGAQLQGGMGMAASINYHPEGVALFEPVHGTAPNIAGQGIANPMATLLTASLLLEYFGHKELARDIENGIRRAIEANVTTTDLGGKSSTKEVGDFVAQNI